MKTIIKNGLFLLPDENGNLCIKPGSVVIDKDLITEISTDSSYAPLPNCHIIDGTNKLYMPGMINTHTHIAMSLLRGYSDDVHLHEWLAKIWPKEAKYEDDTLKWGSMLSIAEMLLSGTTCFSDMYDRTELIAECVEETGIRACLSRAVIDLCSPSELGKKLKQAREISRSLHGNADGRITIMIAPHSPYASSPSTLVQLLDIADELDLPIHMHLAETKQEVIDIQKKYNLSPTQYLLENRVLQHKCIFAHAVHLTDTDIELLSQYHANIAHNPSSNLKLASGISPLTKLVKKGINISLGTDSSASNNRLDMFMEARTAALIHKGVTYDPETMPAELVLRMATVNGAKALFLNNIGTLRVGAKADLIALDIDQPHFYPRTNLISSLVYSASGADVADVWVDGKMLMQNRQLLTIDLEKVKYEFTRVYKKLLG